MKLLKEHTSLNPIVVTVKSQIVDYVKTYPYNFPTTLKSQVYRLLTISGNCHWMSWEGITVNIY